MKNTLKTMNKTVSDFEQNYCGAGCKIEDLAGLTPDEIEAQILTVAPDEEFADDIAIEVYNYLHS